MYVHVQVYALVSKSATTHVEVLGRDAHISVLLLQVVHMRLERPGVGQQTQRHVEASHNAPNVSLEFR